MLRILVISSLLLLFISCSTKKEIIYFQDIETLNDKIIELPFDPVIESNDILYISITSPDARAIAPFVKDNREATGTNTNRNPGLDGYLVNRDGTIRFPYIGDIKVAGSSRSEVVTMIKNELSTLVKDVVVDVRIMNFDITILGEVASPGIYTIADERVTLTEALALAGDLTSDGNRNAISIVREENGKRLVKNIDITKTDFFNSEFYYLKQNDLIYVEPSLKGVKKSGFIPSVPALLSLFSVILSTVIIITR